jgi:hypothetical protein
LNIQALGHDLVTFATDAGSFFQSYVVTSTSNAFEFADNVASCIGEGCRGPAPGPTPLPAALPLFISAIGGVGGLLGWRKRRKNKAVAA